MFGLRVKWVIIAFGISTIILYAAYQARYVIGGPSLIIDQPIDGEIFQDPLITVSGRAKNTTRISLNGRAIYTDEDGNFSAALLLQEGHTIIEMRAIDKFGKERLEERVVVLTPETRLPTVNTATNTSPQDQ